MCALKIKVCVSAKKGRLISVEMEASFKSHNWCCSNYSDFSLHLQWSQDLFPKTTDASLSSRATVCSTMLLAVNSAIVVSQSLFARSCEWNNEGLSNARENKSSFHSDQIILKKGDSYRASSHHQ